MKKVKYIVSDALSACHTRGEIIDAYLLFNDAGVGLMYHPKTSRGACALIEFCIQNTAGVWSAVSSGNGYINITGQKDLDQLEDSVARLEYRRKNQVCE
jgi:hypothetical protein